jgi:hypothetical protein
LIPPKITALSIDFLTQVDEALKYSLAFIW